MGKDWKCSLCNKRFRNEASAKGHVRDKQHKKHAEAVFDQRAPEEPSMADLMVQAEIDRACGEPVPDYLLDMLPD